MLVCVSGVDLDPYVVLGISPAASPEEIRRAYRRRVRQTHPDATGSATAHEFNQVQLAWEYLRDGLNAPEYSSDHGDWRESFYEPPPRDRDVTIDGVHCRIIYDWSAMLTLQIPLEGVERLLCGGWLVDPLGNGTDISKFEVMNNGELVFDAYGYIDMLARKYQQYQRSQQWLAELATFQRKEARLASSGRPTKSLRELLGKFRASIETVQCMLGWVKDNNSHRLRQLSAQITNEIKRLEKGDPSELIVEALMDGSLSHGDHQHNLAVIRALESLSIRSDGFIEPFGEEMLRDHYRACVGSVTDARRVGRFDFKIDLEDYAPADVLGDLELAPTSITLLSNKSTTAYSVTYRFIVDDGEDGQEQQRPCGVITIPLSVYRRSSLPKLPHGISLYLYITLNGKYFAAGFDDARLGRKITKTEKARRRGGQPQSGIGNLGDALFGYEGPTAPPPWYRGKVRNR